MIRGRAARASRVPPRPARIDLSEIAEPTETAPCPLILPWRGP